MSNSTGSAPSAGSLQQKGDQEFLENYSVPEERAQEIRTQVQQLKEADFLENFRVLVQELGQEIESADVEELSLIPTESSKSDKPKIFMAPKGHPSEGLRILLSSNDLKVDFLGQLWLEITFLPKDAEYIVFYINEAAAAEMNSKVESLQELIKAAKAAKNQRQAEWKARFKN